VAGGASKDEPVGAATMSGRSLFMDQADPAPIDSDVAQTEWGSDNRGEHAAGEARMGWAAVRCFTWMGLSSRRCP
jgi:hypothetical protein